MAGSLEPEALDRVAAGLRVAGAGMRLQILAAIAQDEDRRMSPSEFAQRNGGNLREAAYHFRSLRDAQLVELHELQTTGGTAQHFYALSPMGKALVDALPELAKVAPPKRRRR